MVRLIVRWQMTYDDGADGNDADTDGKDWETHVGGDRRQKTTTNTRNINVAVTVSGAESGNITFSCND